MTFGVRTGISGADVRTRRRAGRRYDARGGVEIVPELVQEPGLLAERDQQREQQEDVARVRHARSRSGKARPVIPRDRRVPARLAGEGATRLRCAWRW